MVAMCVMLVGYSALDMQNAPRYLSLYVSLVWTAPILVTLRGLCGAWRVRRTMTEPPAAPATIAPVDLVVCVPTVGRCDTHTALARSILSFVDTLPGRFRSVRVDVIIDEGSEMLGDILELAKGFRGVRVVVVPANYRTAKGTRFKARANHYAHELRIREGEARFDIWVLHMDDDTALGQGTASALSRFVAAQAFGSSGKHLAQGVLAYPREFATSRFTWLADAVRPGCDISLFALATGGGCPTAGLHGELLCVRASVEASIGWDYGPTSTVEDAEFALRFASRYPGASTWLPCRCFGASPDSVRDFLRQRQRWFAGLLRLSAKRSISLRHRALIVHNVCVWSLAPLAYPGLVMLVALALGGGRISPVVPALLPVWGMNVAFGVWLYWEGLKINRASSASEGRRSDLVLVVLLIPAFMFLESLAVARALVAVGTSRPVGFPVITKPR